MKKKKVLGALGIVFMGALLVGCGGSDKNADVELPESRFEVDANTPSWQKDTDHPTKLTWYVNFDWYAQPGW